MSERLILALELSGSGLRSGGCRRRRSDIVRQNFSVIIDPVVVPYFHPCQLGKRSDTDERQRFTHEICESRQECAEYTTPHGKCIYMHILVDFSLMANGK